MPSVVQDLSAHLRGLLNAGTKVDTIVVVEEDPRYPGELVFQVHSAAEVIFYSRYRQWISCYLVLSELFNLQAFGEQLEADGYTVVYDASCARVLADYERYRAPLKIEGYDLHPFQQFSLQRAFETDFWFFNWATGAGKSFCCAAGVKELLGHGDADVVILCTMAKSKINQVRFFEAAGLDVVVNDGDKNKRAKGYRAGHQVYVMNYEKLWVDYPFIAAMVQERNVVWIFDEVHKIITGDKPNKSRVAFEKLVKTTMTNKIWPMSASVVNGNPLRFRDLFALGGGRNPLGTKTSFEARYADEIELVEMKTKTNKKFYLTNYTWNQTRLQEVRHRVGGYTQTARKTDPGLAPYFKGLQTIVEPIQASDQERALSEFIVDRAYDAYLAGVSLAPYFHLLRTTANIPTALLHSQSEVVKELIKAEHWDLDKLMVAAGRGTKLGRLNEMLEAIREGGDKVLVFTHWTNLTLHLIKDHLTVPHVVHYGVGQSDKESQAAQDRFKADPDITCFLTSDAGAHGLNMQCARYVIQYEPTYSYDEGMQRASRIDRSDSHLDGLTNYVFVTEDSVEERVWAINNARRVLTGIVQGTAELQSYESMTGRAWSADEERRARQSEAQNMSWMIFGDRT